MSEIKQNSIEIKLKEAGKIETVDKLRILIQKIAQKLNISIHNFEFYEQALVHPSIGLENLEFQRLEFFGDRVLALITTHYLLAY